MILFVVAFICTCISCFFTYTCTFTCILCLISHFITFSAAIAAARLAKDTTVDSNSAALISKDGGETIGTKALAGMQVSLSNGCVSVEELAKAYKTIKSGSTVSMISTISTHSASKDNGKEADVSTGFATLSEQTEAIGKASMDGNDLCLGSTCFALGTPCEGVDNGDGDTNGRHLERGILHKDIFTRVMEGKSSNGSLRNSASQRLKTDGRRLSCCDFSACRPGCLGCSGCVGACRPPCD